MSEDDEFNVGSVSRLSTTSGTEDGEEDQSLDRIRMLMLNYYGNEGEDDEDEGCRRRGPGYEDGHEDVHGILRFFRIPPVKKIILPSPPVYVK